MWKFSYKDQEFQSDKKTQYDATTDIVKQIEESGLEEISEFQVMAEIKYVDDEKYDPLDAGD